MWWAFVSDDYTAAAVCVTLCFSAHQHRDTVGQAIYFRLLRCHDRRQIVDGALKMRNLFFELFHGPRLG